MIEAFKRLVDWCKEQMTDVEYEVKTLSNGSCPTCNGTKKVRYDTGKPPFRYPVPYKYGEVPNEIVRMDCPDCVPCNQCANPECKGVHNCRHGFKGGRLLKPEETNGL